MCVCVCPTAGESGGQRGPERHHGGHTGPQKQAQPDQPHVSLHCHLLLPSYSVQLQHSDTFSACWVTLLFPHSTQLYIDCRIFDMNNYVIFLHTHKCIIVDLVNRSVLTFYTAIELITIMSMSVLGLLFVFFRLSAV